MIVTENLLAGRHLLMGAGIFSGAFDFGHARREAAEKRKTIERIIDFFELYRYRDMPAAKLSHGGLEIAGVTRALAGHKRLVRELL